MEKLSKQFLTLGVMRRMILKMIELLKVGSRVNKILQLAQTWYEKVVIAQSRQWLTWWQSWTLTQMAAAANKTGSCFNFSRNWPGHSV